MKFHVFHMFKTIYVACDSDTESDTCYSSADVRAWVLLCVSCLEREQTEGTALASSMSLSLPWYKKLMTDAGPCHTNVITLLDQFNFLRVAMMFKSPAVCLILAATLAAWHPAGQKEEDIAYWQETPVGGVVQEFEVKYAQVRK
jgi:hypothetical protein